MLKRAERIPAGETVRELRKSQGVSIRSFADCVGWDRGRQSKYETRRRGISLNVLDNISTALGLDPAAVAVLVFARELGITTQCLLNADEKKKQ